MVYLDLNHWKDLSKAHSGHSEGQRFQPYLDACRAALNSRTAIFPISSTTFFEGSKIGNYGQRLNLRRTIEEISRFIVISNRVVIHTHEVEALLDGIIGANPNPIVSMPYIDWGVARSLGLDGGIGIYDKSDREVTSEFRASFKGGPDAFDRIVEESQLQLNRNVLDGPTRDDEPELRAAGWNPQSAYETAKKRAAQEIEQASRFDENSNWRKEGLRDVIAAREVIIEINRVLSTALHQRGAILDDLVADGRKAGPIFDQMPSFDVAVTLKTSYHRNPMHRWTPNDIMDIDAITAALPYCDIVVTDNAMCSHCRQSGLSERLGTVVLSKLQDLIPHLET